MAGNPGPPCRSCFSRDIHAGGDTVAQSPEQELAVFMAPLPQWLQKALWYSSMTELESYSWLDSINPFTADQLEVLKENPGWQPERYTQTEKELRPDFERILKRCDRAHWKKYKDNAVAIRNADTDRYVPKPRGNAGRPLDSKAQEYFEQHSRDLSYADIAKQELLSEPEGEVKTLRIQTGRERIRASVRRSRRRQPE
jgi:hypothetical protein